VLYYVAWSIEYSALSKSALVVSLISSALKDAPVAWLATALFNLLNWDWELLQTYLDVDE